MKIIAGMTETNCLGVSHAVLFAICESPDLFHFAVSQEIPADILRRPGILLPVIGKEKSLVPLNGQDPESPVYDLFLISLKYIRPPFGQKANFIFTFFTD